MFRPEKLYGSDALRRQIEKQLTLNVGSQETSINYVYSSGVNTVSGIIPLEKKTIVAE